MLAQAFDGASSVFDGVEVEGMGVWVFQSDIQHEWIGEGDV